MIGETPPRGQGFDERAARAAAEVRKKAAARGLTTRSHGIPVQAVLPLTQLLNMINMGATPEAGNGEEAGERREANGHHPNGPADAKKRGINIQGRRTSTCWIRHRPRFIGC